MSGRDVVVNGSNYTFEIHLWFVCGASESSTEISKFITFVSNRLLHRISNSPSMNGICHVRNENCHTRKIAISIIF